MLKKLGLILLLPLVLTGCDYLYSNAMLIPKEKQLTPYPINAKFRRTDHDATYTIEALEDNRYTISSRVRSKGETTTYKHHIYFGETEGLNNRSLSVIAFKLISENGHPPDNNRWGYYISVDNNGRVVIGWPALEKMADLWPQNYPELKTAFYNPFVMPEQASRIPSKVETIETTEAGKAFSQRYKDEIQEAGEYLEVKTFHAIEGILLGALYTDNIGGIELQRIK